jgi:hypothetical protein
LVKDVETRLKAFAEHQFRQRIKNVTGFVDRLTRQAAHCYNNDQKLLDVLEFYDFKDKIMKAASMNKCSLPLEQDFEYKDLYKKYTRKNKCEDMSSSADQSDSKSDIVPETSVDFSQLKCGGEPLVEITTSNVKTLIAKGNLVKEEPDPDPKDDSSAKPKRKQPERAAKNKKIAKKGAKSATNVDNEESKDVDMTDANADTADSGLQCEVTDKSIARVNASTKRDKDAEMDADDEDYPFEYNVSLDEASHDLRKKKDRE